MKHGSYITDVYAKTTDWRRSALADAHEEAEPDADVAHVVIERGAVPQLVVIRPPAMAASGGQLALRLCILLCW